MFLYLTKHVINNIIYLLKIEGGNLKYKSWLVNILSIVREAANNTNKSGLVIVVMIIVLIILIVYIINRNNNN